MALGEMNFGSFMNQEQPNTNQFLGGNPGVDPNANTSWMDKTPTTSQYGNDWNSGGNRIDQAVSQPNTPPSNGTALGAITAGNVGSYMPQGYDQNKWNDPNKHDPKYDIGRVLSKYPPTPAGLDAAMPELEKMGYRRTGKDSIAGADGYPIDVGQGFSDVIAGKTQQGNWWFNPSNPNNGQQSFMGQGNQQQGFMQFLLRLLGGMNNQPGRNIYQAPQSGQVGGFNPSGGQVNISGNTGISPESDISSFLNQSNLSPIRYDQQGNKIS